MQILSNIHMKLILIIKKYKYFCSNSFRELKEYSNKRKIILIDTPSHGNLGDQAIALSEILFLSNECSDFPLFELTQEEYLYCSKRIVRFLTEDDVIIIHGGGFIGTLWPKEESILLKLLKQLSEYNLIIFPQSVYFEQTDWGELEVKKFKEVAENSRNLKLFLRDRKSYDFIQTILNNEKVLSILVPDIVTYMNQINLELVRKEKVLLCIRSDVERLISQGKLKEIAERLEKEGVRICFTDTVIPGHVNKFARKKCLEQKFREFCEAKLIITDRLHGMLFSAITGTPCLAMNNISRKVSGAYEWIKHLDYIEFITEEELSMEKVKAFMNKKNCTYTNENLRGYYEQMKNIILAEME